MRAIFPPQDVSALAHEAIIGLYVFIQFFCRGEYVIMGRILVVLLLGFFSSTALAQDDVCRKCRSKQCAHQCFAGICSWYCVKTEQPKAQSQGTDLHLHLPNATPELAARIRRLIEEKKTR